MLTTLPSQPETSEGVASSRLLATSIFIETLRSEGLRLSNSDDVQRMARLSVEAARALASELAGPTAGPTSRPLSATIRQDSPAGPRREAEPEAMDSDEETELGSIVREARIWLGDVVKIKRTGQVGRVNGIANEGPRLMIELDEQDVREDPSAVLLLDRPEPDRLPWVQIAHPEGWCSFDSRSVPSEQQLADTPYVMEALEALRDEASAKRVVMPAAAQGKTETGSIGVGSYVTWFDGQRSGVVVFAGPVIAQVRERGHDGVLMDSVSVAMKELRAFDPNVIETGPIDPKAHPRQDPDGTFGPLSAIALERIWDREGHLAGSTTRALFATIDERENQRAAAVRRANAIAAERDQQAGQVTCLKLEVADLQVERDAATSQAEAMEAERDELKLQATHWEEEIKHLNRKCASLEGEVAAACDREDSREVESIAPSNFNRLAIGDPVMTLAGLKGEVVGFSRWIDVEVQGRRGTPSTLSFPEDDVTPVTEVELGSGSEHCGEQATMEAGAAAEPKRTRIKVTKVLEVGDWVRELATGEVGRVVTIADTYCGIEFPLNRMKQIRSVDELEVAAEPEPEEAMPPSTDAGSVTKS